MTLYTAVNAELGPSSPQEEEEPFGYDEEDTYSSQS